MIFKLQDLEQISSIAKSHGVVTVIDNTWATPIFQNPLKLGIDIVVHSASKYLGGHSIIIGGALISSKKLLMKLLIMDVVFGRCYGSSSILVIAKRYKDTAFKNGETLSKCY